MAESDATITVEAFLAELRRGRAAWEALLAEIPPQRLEEPGATGTWSVKDVIAHVAWHEWEMAGVLRERALVGSDLWLLDTETRNQAIHEEYRDQPLADVLAEARAAYAAIEAELARAPLTDEELNDSARIRDMVPGYRPWQIFADNTYQHYRAHAAALRDWLERTGR